MFLVFIDGIERRTIQNEVNAHFGRGSSHISFFSALELNLCLNLLSLYIETKQSNFSFQGVNDIFLLVLFFVFFCVIVATFALHLFSDVEAKYPKGGYQPFAGNKIKTTDKVDEKTPLLSNENEVGEPLANGLKSSVNAETKTPEQVKSIFEQ